MPAGKSNRPSRERGASRELILEAASEEFAQNGFAGARIDAIAQRTELNVRMIYYHFRSKEGLYLAVLEAIYRNMAQILDGTAPLSPLVDEQHSASLRAIETAPAGRDLAVMAFERYVDLLMQNPRFADILVREAIDGGKRLMQLFEVHPDLNERVHQRARMLLKGSIQSGSIRPMDAALAVHSLTGMVCLLIAARSTQPLFLGGRTIEPGHWKATLVDLFLHGLAVR